jgi:hypothetical protein
MLYPIIIITVIWCIIRELPYFKRRPPIKCKYLTPTRIGLIVAFFLMWISPYL